MEKMNADAKAWWDQIHERDGVPSPTRQADMGMQEGIQLLLPIGSVIAFIVISYFVSTSGINPDGLIWSFVLIVFAIAIYFVPTIIASKRNVDMITQRMIFLVNFLVGWTLIGWLVCVLWAGLAASRRA